MKLTNIRTIKILSNLYFFSQNSAEYSEDIAKRHKIYLTLLSYYRFKNRCERGVSRLNSILLSSKTLEQRAIREWTINHLSLGQKELLSFYFEYLDYSNDPNRNLYISSLELYIDRKDFIPIIQFWELHHFLSSNQYHLEASEREIPDQNDYYYNSPDPNAPPDLDIVMALLNEDFSLT